VQSHLTRGISPSFGLVNVRLVEYGIARLHDRNSGRIVEPLAFVSLLKWLQTQKLHNIGMNLRSRLTFTDSRGLAYEELVVIYLLRTLRYPVPLDTIFDFHGTAPSWAHGSAQIVGHLNGTNVPVDVITDSPQNPGLGGIYIAETPEDIIYWLQHPDGTPPILIPTILFGPDMLVRMEIKLSSLEVIAMGQDKSYMVGNGASLDAGTTSKAVDSLNEDHWFKKMQVDNPKRRQKLVDALRRHTILRFVGGYPLPPNLNSEALSVNQAISALGTNVPLATLDLHAFEGHFLASHEFSDCLAIMNSALQLKRKASDMDD
jgi:hypothetical protein